MKLIITIQLLAFALCTNAQITLEKTYDGRINIVKLSQGEKLFTLVNTTSPGDFNDFNINIYNSNHSLLKTILLNKSSCPVIANVTITALEFMNITDNAFNANNDFELGMHCRYNGGYTSSLVFSETGNVLFRKDNSQFRRGIIPSLQWGIENLNGQVKMILDSSISIGGGSSQIIKTFIYALPGTLASLSEKDIEKSKLKLYPNPSIETTNLAYSLPSSVKEGEIVVSDINGKILKSFRVDHAFHDIVLDNNEMGSGTFFYSLWIDGKLSTTLKQIIIK